MQTQNIKIRKAKERGHGNYGWLNTYHSFSFGDYHAPEYMGFRSLRVINDDTIKPGKGFDTHRHKDMEILTYIIEGALEHKDSMGTGSVIKQGELQRMSAGSGIAHSEINPSLDQSTRLLQIWILPEAQGLEPSYEQLSRKDGQSGLTLVASGEPTTGILKIHQDIHVYSGRFKEYETVTKTIEGDRGLWIQMIKGKVTLNNDIALDQGDGAAIEHEAQITLTSLTDAEFLLFDAA